MRRTLISLAAACLCLAACTTVPALPPTSGPPAAERCDSAGTVDSRAVCTAFQAFDAALYAVEALRDAGVIRPGTPRAVAVAGAIEEADRLLTEASAIQRGLRSGNLIQVLTNASAALGRLQAAIRS